MNLYHPITEFEIHAVAYCKLRSTFRNVRGELPYKNKCRFDIIIFDVRGRPCLVIEVKKPTAAHTAADDQVIKYNALTGAPVMVICQLWQAESVVEFMESFCRMHKLSLDLGKL